MVVAPSGWKPLPVPGAYIKPLSLEKERGYAVLLGKLDPGTRYPAHLNAGPEDFYILTGDLFIGDRKMVAGDFHHAAQAHTTRRIIPSQAARCSPCSRPMIRW